VFSGCSPLSEGLDVEIFKGVPNKLYYVAVLPWFGRCGECMQSVEDWTQVFAITATGEIIQQFQPKPP
jgi:hypothetical protein